MPCVVLSGLIGAGKSTLLAELAHRQPDAFCVPEPVQTNPFLNDFYDNPAAYSLRMQLWVVATRTKALRERPPDASWLLMDRCIQEDALFAQLLHRQGKMDDRDVELYGDMHALCSALVPLPDLVVYLDVTVDTALARIVQRGRPAEQGIPRDYLEGLKDCYEAWIQQQPHKVLRLDWNQPLSATDVWNQIQAALLSQR